MLTTQQVQSLKAWVTANLVNPTEDTVQDALNAASNPAFIVWKTSVTRREILQNGFDWTRLDNLAVGKARVWNDIFAGENEFGLPDLNPSKLNVRTGIESVWVGTAADLAVRAAVYAHCKRTATTAEKVLASGTGSDAVPATMSFEGEISLQDAIDILNS